VQNPEKKNIHKKRFDRDEENRRQVSKVKAEEKSKKV
jgi:hypothetical protein